MSEYCSEVKRYIFKPCGLESKQTAGSRLIISQQNGKENKLLRSCHEFKVTRNRYCGSPRSEFKKADLCVSLIYSMGISACPAGLGRPCPLGHMSLMDTSLEDDRERKTKMERVRWKCGQFRVILVLEKRKRED